VKEDKPPASMKKLFQLRLRAMVVIDYSKLERNLHYFNEIGHQLV
jgi:hypothetical protein